MTSQDERALLARAQSSSEGFGEFFDRYYDGIYAYAFRRVGSRETAEDVAASVFEDALKSIKRLRWQNKPLAAWLYKIAARRVADSYRHPQNVELSEATIASSDGPGLAIEKEEEFAASDAAWVGWEKAIGS
jgi:RNA polymerase sigma-70 factor (ECF subfamily)